ncbi:MAG: phospholactate guanylyltransferase [uncultured archaeon A07HB70]|nr:MAG: phospholactate guanylyltransferase [uncultured archaeon A07HB70]
MILVPFDARRPKTRLADVLDADERRAFADAMLRDVVSAARAADHEVRVLATAPVAGLSVPVDVDDRPLTPAVNDVLADADGVDPVAVLTADLPLVDGPTVERLLAAAAPETVVIAPGLGGGTNALVVGHPAFRADYHGVSVRDHRAAARSVGATVREVDSRRLATDVDDPGDLAEVLIHAPESRAGRWLADAGFGVHGDDGRAAAGR